jgi:hypothetical protein
VFWRTVLSVSSVLKCVFSPEDEVCSFEMLVMFLQVHKAAEPRRPNIDVFTSVRNSKLTYLLFGVLLLTFVLHTYCMIQTSYIAEYCTYQCVERINYNVCSSLGVRNSV